MLNILITVTALLVLNALLLVFSVNRDTKATGKGRPRPKINGLRAKRALERAKRAIREQILQEEQVALDDVA